MEDYNLKYANYSSSAYPGVEKPPVMNGWIGDTGVLPTAEMPPLQQNTQASVSDNYSAAKTWADMVKKSGNCSLGETRFCVAPNIDNENGIKAPSNDKRRSVGGRFSAERGKGPKHNNYQGSGNSPTNTYHNGGHRMNQFSGDRGFNNRSNYYKNNGGNGNGAMQADQANNSKGYANQRNMLSASNSPNNNKYNNHGGDNGGRGGVSTSIVPMASVQQQFYGMSLNPTVTVPPPGMFTTFGGNGTRILPPAGATYMPVDGGYPTHYVTFATSSAMFASQNHGQSSTMQSQQQLSMEALPHPHHPMTTTQQLHFLQQQHQQQQQQMAALAQQQQQQSGAPHHVATAPVAHPPQMQQHSQLHPPNGQPVSQQQQQLQPLSQQPHSQAAPQPPMPPPQMPVNNHHPQQQAQAPNQSQAPAPPAVAHPQFFIPYSSNNNAPIPTQNSGLIFPQQIVPIPAIGPMPPSLICTPPGTNNAAAVPPMTVNETAANGGIFVQATFQDEKFNNTWLQQNCIPSAQLFNERSLQNFLWTHNNTVATTKERIGNGKAQDNQYVPNLLVNSTHGNSTSAKLFHLK